MNRTLTEDYWLLKGELASMTKKFEEARDLIDKYIQVIQQQEEELKKLHAITRVDSSSKT